MERLILSISFQREALRPHVEVNVVLQLSTNHIRYEKSRSEAAEEHRNESGYLRHFVASAFINICKGEYIRPSPARQAVPQIPEKGHNMWIILGIMKVRFGPLFRRFFSLREHPAKGGVSRKPSVWAEFYLSCVISERSLSMVRAAASLPPSPKAKPNARESATTIPVKSVCQKADATPN